MDNTELTKEQTVSELLALRAGLSEISKKKSMISEKESSISSTCETERLKKVEYDKSVYAICHEKEEKEKIINEKINYFKSDYCKLSDFKAFKSSYLPVSENATYYSAQCEIKDRVQSVCAPKEQALKTIIWRQICFVLGVVIFLSMTIFLFSREEYKNKLPTFFIVAIPVLSIFRYVYYVMLYRVITDKCDTDARSIWTYIRRKKEYDKYLTNCATRDKLLEKLKKWYETNKTIEIKKLQDQITEEQKILDDALTNLKQKYDEEIAEITHENNKIINDCNEIIPRLKLENYTIEESLKQQYPWIAQSDWGNIDMIIYYLQTGRAENMKEALQQVDRQLQTNQIANTIIQSTQYVCTTIQNIMETTSLKMRYAIENKMSTLISKTNSANDMGNLLQKSINSLADTVEKNAKLYAISAEKNQNFQNEILDTTRLNKALLEKSNVTSQALLDDLRYQQKYWIK